MAAPAKCQPERPGPGPPRLVGAVVPTKPALWPIRTRP
jgi:hypothetical protein